MDSTFNGWVVYYNYDCDDMVSDVVIYYGDDTAVVVIGYDDSIAAWTPVSQNDRYCTVDVVSDVEYENTCVDALVSDIMYLLGGWDYSISYGNRTGICL